MPSQKLESILKKTTSIFKDDLERDHQVLGGLIEANNQLLENE